MTAIARLPVRDVTELLSWPVEYHAALRDKQIEYDLDTGKLDTLLAEVGAECAAGVATPLWRTARCRAAGCVTSSYRRKSARWRTITMNCFAA